MKEVLYSVAFVSLVCVVAVFAGSVGSRVMQGRGEAKAEDALEAYRAAFEANREQIEEAHHRGDPARRALAVEREYELLKMKLGDRIVYEYEAAGVLLGLACGALLGLGFAAYRLYRDAGVKSPPSSFVVVASVAGVFLGTCMEGLIHHAGHASSVDREIEEKIGYLLEGDGFFDDSTWPFKVYLSGHLTFPHSSRAGLPIAAPLAPLYIDVNPGRDDRNYKMGGLIGFASGLALGFGLRVVTAFANCAGKGK